MANTEIIDAILITATQYFVYMLPIIGILAGLNWLASFLMSVTMGMGKRTFRG